MNSETSSFLRSSVATVVAVAESLPRYEQLDSEIKTIEFATERGYFLPDEDLFIRTRYAQYLTLRVSLLGTIEEVGALAGKSDLEWSGKLPLFAVSFAAACILLRANRFVVDLAAEEPVLWKKLDEPDQVNGIPRKSFTTIFKALSDLKNQSRFLHAAEFFMANREAIYALSSDPLLKPIIEILTDEHDYIESKRTEIMKRRLAYRWFSFIRRNRSAWKHVMGGLFEVSGRAVADLRQPGVKKPTSKKRITASLQDEILPLVQAGDVFVTRHDDALSNWFLPGFWPHAALYLGNTEDGHTQFLESKKDGVLVREARETLAVDSLIVLRPPLDQAALDRGIEQAMQHAGKPYDFLFDFRTADRLVCTEVVYRGFHGIDSVNFQLCEVGGRLCLPAEKLIDQALACGYQLILTAGIDGGRILTGKAANEAFLASRHLS